MPCSSLNAGVEQLYHLLKRAVETASTEGICVRSRCSYNYNIPVQKLDGLFNPFQISVKLHYQSQLVGKILLLSNVLTTTNWSTCSFFILCGELNVHRKIQYCRQSRDKHWGHSTCSVLPSLLQYMNKQHLFPLNVLCKYSCTLNPRQHGHNPFPSQILVFHFGHA